MTSLTRVFTTLATLALTTTTTAQQQPSLSNNEITFPSTFEMDFLFPQNKTYKTSEIFPLVFAIQNVSALHSAISTMEKARNISTESRLRPQVSWHVDAYRRDGLMPGYVAIQTGYINLTDATITQPADKGDYVILTNIINMTDILQQNSGAISRPDFRYVITYYVQIFGDAEFNQHNGFCMGDKEYGHWGNAGIGQVIFNIYRPELEHHLSPEDLVEAKKAKEVDVMKVIPECPEYATLVDILPNITALETGNTDDECPVYFDGHEDFPMVKKERANPCALKVDKSILSAISSEVVRLATPTTTEEVFTSTSTGAAGFATGFVRPMQTALAAACVLGGLALQVSC